MAANLVRAGFDVVVWNRTSERAKGFAREFDARAADTPAEAARGCEILITMVVDSPQVEQILFGEDGAVEGLERGALAVDMSTVAPSASVAIAKRLGDLGIDFLDAPVTGSRPRAEEGSLTIMVGGARNGFERARAVFEALGTLVVHVGPNGHGSTIKLINNTLAAANAAALAEALVLAQAAGVDTDALREVTASGSGASAALTLKAGAMLEHDFEPLFKLEHILKDLRHCLSVAERLGVDARVAREAAKLYAEADAAGLGGSDFAAVISVVEEASRSGVSR
ncbi:MAG: NAD(P)-dependent oxidoreductase [Thermoleophilaceae bacterium]